MFKTFTKRFKFDISKYMTETKKETKKDTSKKTDKYNIDIEEMARLGVAFGHRSSKKHPKMEPYILGVKGGEHVNIINLEKTKEMLEKALDYLSDLAKEKKTILFVGTKPSIKNLVLETARECNMPFVIHRWIGGTLTNFKVIRKRVEYFINLKEKMEKGELKKYTKKEQHEFEKEIKDLEEKFGGLEKLTKLPDALFVVDMKKEDLAIREAKRKNIPVVAIADTNVDPTLADYPIPANDDAISSVKYILEKVKQAILGKQP